MKIFDYKKSVQDGSLKFILILLLSSAIGLPPLLSRSQNTSPIQVVTYFFLCPHVKEAQAGCPLTATSPKPAWVGVTATTAKEAYVAVFWKQFKRCLQAIQLEDECAENNAKTLILLTCLLFVLFSLSGFRPNTPRIQSTLLGVGRSLFQVLHLANSNAFTPRYQTIQK